MVADGINSMHLGEALHDVGLLPENCRSVELITKIADVIVLRYEVSVRFEDLPKLATALSAVAERLNG